jgi:hypothetical protein
MSTTPHFDTGKETLSQIAQSLLEVKKMGRSAENTADSFQPLTDNDEVKNGLLNIAQHGAALAEEATKLYRLIAREAMKP